MFFQIGSTVLGDVPKATLKIKKNISLVLLYIISNIWSEMFYEEIEEKLSYKSKMTSHDREAIGP